MQKDILVVPHNHLDPTWRRCFDKKSTYNGVTIASYYEIEEHLINSFLELANQGYVYSDGQTAILRKYLEKNPDKKTTIKSLVQKNLCEIHLSGETIQDTNLPTAEGLIRNFLVAKPIYDELCGENHLGQKLGWTYDAFGNSPNYPQILKGVGAEVACMTTYKPCTNDIWVGIDGTKLPCYDNHPCIRTGFYEKQPPCSACKGEGCIDCHNTGIAFKDGFNMQELTKTFEQAIEYKGDWVAIFITVEEHMAEKRLPELIKKFNEKYSATCHFRIANPNEIYSKYKPILDKALAETSNLKPIDLNPAMSGCYVSRIKTKQRTRALSYKAIQIEAQIAMNHWQKDIPQKPSDDFSKVWQLISFNQFHDAITGTHIDSAYLELMGMLDQAEQVLKNYSPLQTNISPATLIKKGAKTIKSGIYEITADITGILMLTTNGQNVIGKNPKRHPSAQRPFNIGELLLEPDFGDAWGTRMPPFKPAPDRSHSIPLGSYNNHFEIQNDRIIWKGSYNGGDPMVKNLEWEICLQVNAKSNILDFYVTTNWDTNSKRLKAFFPFESEDLFATWEVPFGFIDRFFNEAEINYSQWRGNDMNFPALHWVHKETNKQSGMAVINEGLPCYRWYPGQLDLSLVRSPQWAFCSVEVANYEFWDIDGQRDTGKHTFHFGLLTHTEPISKTELTRLGYEFNNASIKHPFKIEGNHIVTAFKLAEKGDAWVLRLQETNGESSTIKVDFKKVMEVQVANLLEMPEEDLGIGMTFTINLHKFQIKTLLIKPPK